LGWPQAPHWATISCEALSTWASIAAGDRLWFVWGRSKSKLSGSDDLQTYKRCYNLVCVLRRSNLGWPQAPPWATISCEALSTWASTAAGDRLWFVWDRSKSKSSGSDDLLTYKRCYNFVCVLRRSNLGWQPAPPWATISCVALSTWASTAAGDRLWFVWDSSTSKSSPQTNSLSTNDATTSYVY
jgi:hypothetical protein